tara:strand:- start:29 stop:550 length:522 start_codon:yes stop_codon:yes gene_type:complete
MDSCKCGLGKSVNHESVLKTNSLEIRRLRWSEPFKVAKPKVVELLERNISITNCIGEDVSNLESKLAEYENKRGIRKSSQLGARKIHPDVMGNRVNRGAIRNPEELQRERDRLSEIEKRRREKRINKEIKKLKMKIKKVEESTDPEWRGHSAHNKAVLLERWNKKLNRLKNSK